MTSTERTAPTTPAVDTRRAQRGQAAPAPGDPDGAPRRSYARVGFGPAGVAVVACLAGLLFVVSAADASGDRRPENLVEYTRAKAAQVQHQAAQVDALRAQVDALTAAVPDVPGAVSVPVQVAAGSVAVAGPGLVITLDDAPVSAARDNVDPDVLVVHQQDLQAVVNAMWAGGAEAVAVQDQRIITTTSLQCVGNVLRLGGRVYSPPYTISAVGDPAALRAGLDQSPQVLAYVRDADEVGLGWSVRPSQSVQLPAYSGATGLVHAHVPPGTDVLGTVGSSR